MNVSQYICLHTLKTLTGVLRQLSRALRLTQSTVGEQEALIWSNLSQTLMSLIINL